MSLPFGTALVLGGARSGKSRYAERLVCDSGLERLYIATSPVVDDETRARITLHKQQRGAGWRTIEEELDICTVLQREADPQRIILLDCLTLWLNNLFYHKRNAREQTEQLVASLSSLSGPVIFVSNEIGLGLVPPDPLSRDFRDAQGRLNQSLAAACDRVVFVAAGLPLVLKPSSQPDMLS